MIGITTETEACHFGVDLRTPGFGVLVFFQYDYTSAFTDNKAITVSIPRSAGAYRVVVAPG